MDINTISMYILEGIVAFIAACLIAAPFTYWYYLYWKKKIEANISEGLKKEVEDDRTKQDETREQFREHYSREAAGTDEGINGKESAAGDISTDERTDTGQSIQDSPIRTDGEDEPVTAAIDAQRDTEQDGTDDEPDLPSFK